MPYFELAKRQGRVIGIGTLPKYACLGLADLVDFWFLLIDYSGAFFSLMALGKVHFARRPLSVAELTSHSCSAHF